MRSGASIDADYIIAGAGCAGLSLAVQLKRSGLCFSKVILIDKNEKGENDRTWCFWTRERNNWFDEIVFKKWDHFEFRYGRLRQSFDLNPYQYQMIRGSDFYTYCLEELGQDKRFEFILDEIRSISGDMSGASITTSKTILRAKVLFNSVVRNLNIKNNHINYVQHFKGWLVECEQPVFSEGLPVFMDFAEELQTDCRFFYTIPYSSTKALVEYTGFTGEPWPDAVYEQALGKYLEKKYAGKKFIITETESGTIPMFESAFINPHGEHVVNIGSAGGTSKPSTGYTFYFIQKHAVEIIAALRENGLPASFERKGRFRFYDKVLLEVLDKKELAASGVFWNLFKKNNIQNILAFLNEESSMLQELKIMNSVNKVHFLKAALKKLF